MNDGQFQKLENKENKQVRKLINELSHNSKIYALIRYGSSVKINDYKDIDLCIISQKDISVKEKYHYRVFLPEKFDVHFFHDLPLYIQHEILKNGVYEYLKDYNALFDICSESIKKFSLFKPRYKTYLELI
ncbi:MAG: nucleotidyltransferase domain-containing protein [Promethearchaeota archaeon]